MELRKHPRMRNHGESNWPPVWYWPAASKNQYVTGEIGILKQARISAAKSVKSLFLTMEHADTVYLTSVVFDDRDFCERVYKLLVNHCGKPLQQIGDLDVPL